MTAAELLQFLVNATFLLVALFTLLDFLRHKDLARLDILLVFASIAVPVFSSLVNNIQPRPDFAPLLSTLSGVALIAHPVFLLRLVRHFQDVRRWVFGVALAGLIISDLMLLFIPTPLPGAATLFIVIWFAFVEVYCAVCFTRGAVRTGGVTRARLLLASAGSIFLALIFLAAAPVTLLPALQPVVGPVDQVLALLSGISYYLGFAPPRWLRRTWQLSELQEFLEENTRLPRESRTAQAISNLSHAVSDGVGAIAVWVALWDEAQAKLIVQIDPPQILDSSVDNDWTKVWLQRRPVFTRRLSAASPAGARLMREHGAGAMLAVPLTTSQHAWGVLLAMLLREPLFPDDDIHLLTLLCEQAAILLDYGALLDAQQAAAERASALSKLSEQLARVTLDYQTLLPTIAERTCSLFGDSSVITLLSEDGQSLQPVAWYRADPDGREMLKAMLAAPQPIDRGRAGQVMATGQPLLVPVVSEEQGRASVASEFLPYVERYGIHSVLMVPLRAQDHVIGTLGLTRDRTSRSYTRDEQLFLQDIADRAALAIVNARAYVERQETEALLARQKSELERSNADLEQFAYVASHDLQEPLQMVSSFVQLLARRYQGKLDPTADEYIGFAVNGAARMRALINDLLSYSRVGTRGGKFQNVDCENVLALALSNLAVAVAAAEGTVTHDPLPTIVADPSQMLQLFQNLIGNALKFRAGKPACVHVSGEVRAADWLFAVRDNGEGIDPQYFERIFTIFQRLHKRNEYEGTGIGLAICKKIVERHGGRIWVESQPGQGATFFFTILKRELSPDDESTARTH